MVRALVKLFCTGCLIGASSAYAGDVNPSISQPHIMNDAVRIQVTPRGQKYFDAKLTTILGNLGINPAEGYFPTQSFSAAQPISLTSLQNNPSEAAKVFVKVREMMTKWFVGLSINDPRPTVEIGQSGYFAQFNRFALVTDEATMSKLGKRDGAVMAIEMDIKKLSMNAKTIRAWDLNNPHLDKISFEGFSANATAAAGADKSIKVRIPFYIRITPEGALEFEILDVSTNLDKADISLAYKKFLTPQITLTMAGKTYPFNTAELDKLLQASMPQILIELRSHLGDFTKRQLPDLLNKKGKEFLAGAMEQVQDMWAPGADDNDKRPNFKWGCRVSSINLKKSLNINLNSYIEDPIAPNIGLKKETMSRGQPTLALLPPENYDVGIAVDRGLVNRALDLSFQRKNFDKIPLSEGDPLTLGKAPTIDFMPPVAGAGLKPQETLVKIHLNVKSKPNSWFLQKVIFADVDLITRLRPTKGGMELVIWKMDVDSVAIDKEYYNFLGSIIPGTVLDGIKAEIAEANKHFLQKEEKIPGVLPLPPELLGAKFDVNRIAMDPNGFLVMYLNYTAETFNPAPTSASPSASPAKAAPATGVKK